MVEAHGERSFLGGLERELGPVLGEIWSTREASRRDYGHFQAMVKWLAQDVLAGEQMARLEPEASAKRRYERNAATSRRALRQYIRVLEEHEDIRAGELNPAFADGGYLRNVYKQPFAGVRGSYSLSVVAALKEIAKRPS